MCPSESQLIDVVLPAVQNDVMSEKVTFENLEPFLLTAILRNDFLPDDFAKLMKCFKKLDQKGKGELKISVFRNMVKQSEYEKCLKFRLSYNEYETNKLIDFLPKDKE